MAGFDELDFRETKSQKGLPGIWFEQRGGQWCNFLRRRQWRRVCKLSCMYLGLLVGAHEEFSVGYFMFEVSSGQLPMFIVQKRDWRLRFGRERHLCREVVTLQEMQAELGRGLRPEFWANELEIKQNGRTSKGD